MEWIKVILEKYKKEDGTVDLDAANKEIDAEFPKNAVPKADFNSKNEELKTANATIDTLQKSNEGVEELQTEIKNYKATVETLQKEQAESTKKHTAETALRDARATDVEYMMFKLGELEMNKDGTIKDLDNKVKSLKEASPTFFGEDKDPEDDKGGAPNGFKVIDNKLDTGKPSKSYSLEEINKMTTEEINQNWEAVSASLEKGE